MFNNVNSLLNNIESPSIPKIMGLSPAKTRSNAISHVFSLVLYSSDKGNTENSKGLQRRLFR